jgi:hypothetical protein
VAARAHLVEALRLAWVEGPRVFAAAALDALAVAAGRQQAWQAVHLLSTAARLRQAMGAPAWPIDRPAIEAALAAARAALGDDAYAAAWSMGQRQPVEQIVARMTSPGAAGPGRQQDMDGKAGEDRALLHQHTESPHPGLTRKYQAMSNGIIKRFLLTRLQ